MSMETGWRVPGWTVGHTKSQKINRNNCKGKRNILKLTEYDKAVFRGKFITVSAYAAREMYQIKWPNNTCPGCRKRANKPQISTGK